MGSGAKILEEVMTDDGDFDAEKILSTIGPRPDPEKSRVEENAGFLGDEIFEDGENKDNLRKLSRYEEGGYKPRGIDIRDVFGRQERDDYDDYKFDTEYFHDRQDGEVTFNIRKDNLLQKFELDPSEVNSLVALKLPRNCFENTGFFLKSPGTAWKAFRNCIESTAKLQ